MRNSMVELETLVQKAAVEIAVLYPSISFFRARGCHKCQEDNMLYVIYDGSSGLPSMRYGVTLYSKGDGNSKWFDGGTLPSEHAPQNMGNGCFVSTITMHATLSEGEFLLRTLRDTAKQLYELESSQTVAA